MGDMTGGEEFFKSMEVCLSGECSPLLQNSTEEVEVTVNAVKKISTRPGSNWIMSSFIVVNAALGAGVLNFPAAFNEAGGIVVAMTVQMGFLILACLTLLILAFCADIVGSATYQETVRHLCGRAAGVVCSVTIAIYCFFTCVTFLVIVGDQSDRLLSDRYGHDFCFHWYMNRKFIVSLLAVLIIWPFCYAKQIDFLKYVSGVATFSVIYLVVLIVVNFFLSDRTKVHVKTGPNVWTDVFLVMPAICFGYQCHVSVIPVYSCLQPHSLKNFVKATSSAMVMCILTYSAVGIFGYLTYGTEIRSDIWSNLNTRLGYVLAGLIIFALKTFLAYPILAFCGRSAVETVWIEIFGPHTNRRRELRWRIVVSTLWFVISLLCALVIPNLQVVIGTLGSLASLFLFVFPGFCLIKAVEIFDGSDGPAITKSQRNIGLTTAVGLIAVGIFIFGTVLTQNIRVSSQQTSGAEPPLCYL